MRIKERSASMDYSVYLLCANWCGVCREFEPVFKETVLGSTAFKAHWIDIEEFPEWEDRVNIDSFPTLHVENIEGKVLFSGSIEPDGDHLTRILSRI